VARVFAEQAWESAQELGCTSRYEMILMAAHKARKVKRDELARGERPTVHALRLFEDKLVDYEDLYEDYIKSKQTVEPPKLTDEEDNE
jgi:DNA-directed RNA polymerase subunit K/omega|tara:strand:+ start:116 stop:379 length:264 start_codon:yes stop_codon:yes gene_type:complete